MQICKVPKNNRRLEKIASLIRSLLFAELSVRYHRLDFEIIDVALSKDLKNARIKCYSRSLSKENLLEILSGIRVIVQKKISEHGLRNTPVLNFFWDKDYALLQTLLQE